MKTTLLKKMLLYFSVVLWIGVVAQAQGPTRVFTNFAEQGDWSVSDKAAADDGTGGTIPAGTHTVENGHLVVSMGAQSDPFSGKYRGDIAFNAGTNLANFLKVNPASDKIIAIKFIVDGTYDRPDATMKLEMKTAPVDGDVWLNRGGAKHSSKSSSVATASGNAIVWFDFGAEETSTTWTGATADLSIYRFNVAVADNTSTTKYKIDWIASFENTDDLEMYANFSDDANDTDESSVTGQISFDFDTPVDQESWEPQQSPAAVSVADGSMKVTYAASQDGSTSKFRSDLKFTDNPLYLHGGDYPIFAMKFNVAPPVETNYTLDTRLGSSGSENTTYRDNYGVVYFDLASVFSSTILTDALTSTRDLFQIKIADGVTPINNDTYELDWIKSFASITDLEVELGITNKWDGTNWSKGTFPTSTENVIVDGQLIISEDVAVKDIEVTSNGSVLVNSGASLTIMGNALGNATFKRNTTGNMGYSIVGAPVTGADVSALGAEYLYTWDGAAWAVPTGTMTPGMGYFVGNDEAAPEVSLMGGLVSGDQSVAVIGSGTSGHDGFNLVANPYAAAIAVDQFLSANTSVSGVYLWDDAGANIGANRAGDYYMVNAIGSVNNTVDLSGNGQGTKGTTGAASGFIGSMQGFFVNVAADGNVDFTPAMQSTTAGANADANFYRTIDQSSLKLSLSGGSFYNEVLFGFRSDATEGVDNMFDAVKKIGNEDFAFYSILDKNKYAIQGLPELNGLTTLELGYKVAEAGTYELSIKELEGISEDYVVIASYNRVDHNLTSGAANLNLAAGKGKIQLTLTKVRILGTSLRNGLKIFNADGMLKVQVDQPIDMANVQVVDLTGRTVLSLKEQSFVKGQWSEPVSLQSGRIYIIKIQSEEGTFTQKFIY